LAGPQLYRSGKGERASRLSRGGREKKIRGLIGVDLWAQLAAPSSQARRALKGSFFPSFVKSGLKKKYGEKDVLRERRDKPST